MRSGFKFFPSDTHVYTRHFVEFFQKVFPSFCVRRTQGQRSRLLAVITRSRSARQRVRAHVYVRVCVWVCVCVSVCECVSVWVCVCVSVWVCLWVRPGFTVRWRSRFTRRVCAQTVCNILLLLHIPNTRSPCVPESRRATQVREHGRGGVGTCPYSRSVVTGATKQYHFFLLQFYFLFLAFVESLSTRVRSCIPLRFPVDLPSRPANLDRRAAGFFTENGNGIIRVKCVVYHIIIRP